VNLNLLYAASVLLRARVGQLQGLILPPGVPNPRPKTNQELEALLSEAQSQPRIASK
jgi:hypothetical protein